jgi:predicted glycosyltransferase involved in capsule biosynthesis
MIKNITMLISVRGEERRQSLIKLLQFAHMGWLKNHYKIHTVIIEQDREPHYKQIADMFQCQYIFAKNTVGFNRSWGFNVGVKHVSEPTDMFICCDVDVIFPSFWIPEIVQKMQKENMQILLPFTDIYHISHGHLRTLAQNTAESAIDTIDRWSRNPAGFVKFTHDASIGTVCAVTKDFYYEAQGHNEAYETWGCEDVDWALKCEHLTGTHLCFIRSPHVLFHIEHPTMKPDFQTHEFHMKNLDLTTQIWSTNLKETVEKLKAGTLQPIWGELNRYEK